MVIVTSLPMPVPTVYSNNKSRSVDKNDVVGNEHDMWYRSGAELLVPLMSDELPDVTMSVVVDVNVSYLFRV